MEKSPTKRQGHWQQQRQGQGCSTRVSQVWWFGVAAADVRIIVMAESCNILSMGCSSWAHSLSDLLTGQHKTLVMLGGGGCGSFHQGQPLQGSLQRVTRPIGASSSPPWMESMILGEVVRRLTSAEEQPGHHFGLMALSPYISLHSYAVAPWNVCTSKNACLVCGCGISGLT